MASPLDEIFGKLICPHCGYAISNARKICPKRKNNIEDAKKESNSELIIVGISLAVGALTSFLAIKIGITSNSWLLIIFIGVALATRPFIRNMLYKR